MSSGLDGFIDQRAERFGAITPADPLERYLNQLEQSDPLERYLQRLEGSAGGGGGSPRTSTVREMEREASRLQSDLGEQQSYLGKTISNVPGDVGEFLGGLKVMGGGLLQSAIDSFKAGGYVLTGQMDKAREVNQENVRRGNLIVEGVKAEVGRIKDVYGALFRGDGAPLAKQFSEDPIFTIMDFAGFTEIGAAPFRIGASAIRRTTNRSLAAARAVDIADASEAAGVSTRAARQLLSSEDPYGQILTEFKARHARNEAERLTLRDMLAEQRRARDEASLGTALARDVPEGTIYVGLSGKEAGASLRALDQGGDIGLVGSRRVDDLDPSDVRLEIDPHRVSGEVVPAVKTKRREPIKVKTEVEVDVSELPVTQPSAPMASRKVARTITDLKTLIETQGRAYMDSKAIKMSLLEKYRKKQYGEGGKADKLAKLEKEISDLEIELEESWRNVGEGTPRLLKMEETLHSKLAELEALKKEFNVEHGTPVKKGKPVKGYQPRGLSPGTWDFLRDLYLPDEAADVVDEVVKAADIPKAKPPKQQYRTVVEESREAIKVHTALPKALRAIEVRTKSQLAKLAKSDLGPLFDFGDAKKTPFGWRVVSKAEQVDDAIPDKLYETLMGRKPVATDPAVIAKLEKMVEIRNRILSAGAHAEAWEQAKMMAKAQQRLTTAAEKIRSASPLHLMVRTIGKLPPVPYLRHKWGQYSAIMDLTTEIGRRGGSHMTDAVRRVRTKLRGKGFTPDDYDRVLEVLQGVGRQASLTERQQVLANALREEGASARQILIEADPKKFTHERMDEALITNAMSSVANVSIGDARALVRATDDFFARKIKAPETNIKKIEAFLKKSKPGSKRTLQLEQRLAYHQNLAASWHQKKIWRDMLQEKLKAGELGFIPGQGEYLRLLSIAEPGVADDLRLMARLHNIAEPTSHHMKRKLSILNDPLAVESAFTEYAISLSQFTTRRSLLAEFKKNEWLVPIERKTVAHKLLGQSILDDGKPRKGMIPVLVDGKRYLAPEGLGRMLNDIINPKPAGLLTKNLVDLPTSVFRRMALAYSPRWLTFNMLGNFALLTAAHPVKGPYNLLFKAFPRALADKLVEHQSALGKSPGKWLTKLADEWRTYYPNSQVMGIMQAESNMHNFHNPYPEYIGPAEMAWGEYGDYMLTKHLRKIEANSPAAGKIARAATGVTVMPIQEFIEEWYRGAMWLTEAEKRVRAMDFQSLGQRLFDLDSVDQKALIAKMAKEMGPLEVLPGEGFKQRDPSNEARATAANVNYWMNDYYRLGPVERRVFRRVFPFFSWMKFINRLAFQLPYDHPFRVAAAAHMTNVFNDTFANDPYLPDWMKEVYPVKEHPDGTVEYRSGAGVNIFTGVVLGKEGLNIREIANGINPTFLVPIELMAGFNFFRMSRNRVSPARSQMGGEAIPFLEGDQQGLIPNFRSGKTFKVHQDGRIEELSGARPSVPLAIARGFGGPMFQAAEEALRGGTYDDVGTLGELIFEFGRIVNQETRINPGAFRDPSNKTELLAERPGRESLLGFTGLQTRRYDVEALKRNRLEDLLSGLRRAKREKLSNPYE